jgi:C_GCAxxG_C_C family probable redox protein
MSAKSEEAVERFKNGFNCSQAVLGTFSEQFGLDCDIGFGSGMRMGGTCGAVTGAFMALGLKYGNSTAKNKQAKTNTYNKIEEFTKRFKNRKNSVICRELIGCDICTPDGMKEARDKDLFSTICSGLVQNSAEILEEMLNE